MSVWIPSRKSTSWVSLTVTEVDVEDSTDRPRRRLGRLPCLDDPRMKVGELETTARLHDVKDIINARAECFFGFPGFGRSRHVKFWDSK